MFFATISEQKHNKKGELKMKTLKWKLLAAAGMVSAFFVLTSADSSLNSNTNNEVTAEISPGSDNIASSSSPNGRFEKENMDIRHDLSNISMQREKINSLEEKLKADKKADRKMEMLADKKELAKARAALKRDKNYLTADKKDLKCDHKLALSEKRKEIGSDKKALKENRKALDRELSKGNETHSQEYATEVVHWQNELKSDEATLAHNKTDMKDNLTAVNKAIKKSDEKSGIPVVVASKNTSSSVSSNSR